MITPQGLAIRIIVALVLAIALAGGGFWGGVQYTRGQYALAERTELVGVAETYRKQLQDAAQDFRSAADRMATISKDYQSARADGESFYADLQTRWARYWSTRPDLAGCRLDADGLRHWNAANRGDFADPAAADPGGSARAVPAAATGDRRQPAGADGKPHAGDEAL